MGRQPCCEKVGLKRGPWTVEEDSKLIDFILNNGIKCWRLVPKLAGLMRCGKSCRLRWINYLRPDLKRGAFTEAEEDMIIQLHARLGNRWSKIAAHFPGRTDNEIKNHWNTRIKKKLKQLGLDPITHTPIHDHHKITKPTNNDKQLVNQENPNLTDQDHKDCQLISGSNDHQDNIISIDDQSCRNTTLEMEMEMGSSSLMLPNYIDFSTDSSWMDDNPFLWDDFTYPENSFAY